MFVSHMQNKTAKLQHSTQQSLASNTWGNKQLPNNQKVERKLVTKKNTHTHKFNTIQYHSYAIDDELGEQNRLLDDLESGLDRTQGNMSKVQKGVSKLLADTSKHSVQCALILTLIVLVMLIWIVV